MKRFSVRLFALGLGLGVLGTAAVLAVSAYASTSRSHATTIRGAAAHLRSTEESGQPVVDWNQVLPSIVNTPGAQPANVQPTRNFAILHAAIYDAVNSVDRTHEPYLISVHAPRDASETAAADAAAHTALIGLYPAQQGVVDADYAAELAQVPDGPAKDKGIRLGDEVASELLAIRANDGSNVTPPPFVAGTNPGDYRPTPPNFPAPAFTTWGQVTPFMLERGEQFRPAAGSLVTRRAHQVLGEAVELLRTIGAQGMLTAIAEGTFGVTKRPPDGGKGMDGVVARADGYFNPAAAFLEAPERLPQRGTPTPVS